MSARLVVFIGLPMFCIGVYLGVCADRLLSTLSTESTADIAVIFDGNSPEDLITRLKKQRAEIKWSDLTPTAKERIWKALLTK